MADAYLIKKTDGSFRVALLADLGANLHGLSRTAWAAALAEVCDRTGDTVIGLIEVQPVEDVAAELCDEIEATRAWAHDHHAQGLRDHARRVVERWRARQAGRGI